MPSPPAGPGPFFHVTTAAEGLDLSVTQQDAWARVTERPGTRDAQRQARTLARRRGLPILLSVVYIEVARRHGVGIDGIGFPGHFIVSPRGVEPRFFIDPFHKGLILRPERLLQRHCEGTGARGVDPGRFRPGPRSHDRRGI